MYFVVAYLIFEMPPDCKAQENFAAWILLISKNRKRGGAAKRHQIFICYAAVAFLRLCRGILEFQARIGGPPEFAWCIVDPVPGYQMDAEEQDARGTAPPGVTPPHRRSGYCGQGVSWEANARLATLRETGKSNLLMIIPRISYRKVKTVCVPFTPLSRRLVFGISREKGDFGSRRMKRDLFFDIIKSLYITMTNGRSYLAQIHRLSTNIYV